MGGDASTVKVPKRISDSAKIFDDVSVDIAVTNVTTTRTNRKKENERGFVSPQMKRFEMTMLVVPASSEGEWKVNRRRMEGGGKVEGREG